METDKHYINKLEELRCTPYYPDYYTPNMGDFSLDITYFLCGKLEAIFDQSQKDLIVYTPAKNTSYSQKLPLGTSWDYMGNFNSSRYTKN
jgi:hypothetical protein